MGDCTANHIFITKCFSFDMLNKRLEKLFGLGLAKIVIDNTTFNPPPVSVCKMQKVNNLFPEILSLENFGIQYILPEINANFGNCWSFNLVDAICDTDLKTITFCFAAVFDNNVKRIYCYA